MLFDKLVVVQEEVVALTVEDPLGVGVQKFLTFFDYQARKVSILLVLADLKLKKKKKKK